MYLTNTTETLQVILGATPATNQSVVTVDYGENTATTFVAGKQRSVTNGTTAVNILSAPAASTQRIVQLLTMTNADTAPIVVTIRTNDGGTLSPQFGPVTLLPNERVEFATDTGFRVYDASGGMRSSGPIPAVTSYKNLLINGAFRLNQRVFAGGALAAGVYGYDRWKAGTGGCNVSVNATTFVVTHTSGPLVQIMEAPRLAGEVVTVSVLSPSGSVSVNVDGQTGTITAGSGRRSATVTVPGGSTGDVTLTLTATGVTYSDVQLERGGAATTFEFRPAAMELALAQRYYEKSYALATAPGSITTLGQAQYFLTPLPSAAYTPTVYAQFKVNKRATPTMTWYSTTTGASGVLTDNPNGSNPAITTQSVGVVVASAGAMMTGSNSTINMSGQWTSDSEL